VLGKANMTEACEVNVGLGSQFGPLFLLITAVIFPQLEKDLTTGTMAFVEHIPHKLW